jgi:hypothetical protein
VRALLVVVAISTVAHANPLGMAWRTKYPTKECRPGIDVGGELVGVGAHTLVFFDRATGKQRTTALPKLDGKRPADAYVHAVVGDTVIVGTSTVPIGLDAKTGVLRWQRTPSSEKTYHVVFASGGTHVVEAVVTRKVPLVVAIERFDAATGTTAWKANVPTQRTRFDEVLTSDNHVFVVTSEAKGGNAGNTIVAFDLAGKQVWAVDEPVGYLAKLATSGDHLVAIKDNVISVFDGATGVKKRWEVYWNAHPIVAGDAVYATPVDHSVEAYELAGTKRWTTKLPGTSVRDTRVIGTASEFVYVHDGDFVRTLDAKTGKLLGGTGIPDLDRFAIHASAPAFTRCTGGSGRSLVAYDPSTPAPEHRVKLRGRVRCRNCDADSKIELAIGDASLVLGPNGTFSLDIVARGTLSLDVGDVGFVPSRIRLVDFTADRTLTLGDVPVTVPVRGFD